VDAGREFLATPNLAHRATTGSLMGFLSNVRGLDPQKMLFSFNKLLVFLGVSVKQNVYLGGEKQYFPVARLLESPSLIENKVGFYSFPP